MSYVITRAQAEDLPEVLTLLTQVNLPHAGVAEHFNNFFIARTSAGELIGCIGQERYGKVALLRSLAVTPTQQTRGIGRALMLELLAEARAQGVQDLVLLTTTAADFFQHHFGFAPVPRTQYDATLAASPEWQLPVCSSARCLCLPLV